MTVRVWNRVLGIVLAAAVLAAAAPARADRVTLKDGKVLDGTVVKEDGDGIVFRVTGEDGKDVDVPIPRSAIASLEKAPEAAPAPGEKAAAAPGPKTAPAPGAKAVPGAAKPVPAEEPVRVRIITLTGETFEGVLLADEPEGVTVKMKLPTGEEVELRFARADIKTMEMLDDSEEEARLREQVRELLPALESEEWEVAANAARDIYKLGPPVAPILREELAGATGGKQRWLIQVLGQLGDAESAPLIIPLLDTEDRELLLGAIRAVGTLGLAEAVPRLARILQTATDKDVRRMVLDAFARIDDPGVLAPLARALGDEDPWVQMKVIRALQARLSYPVPMDVRIALEAQARKDPDAPVGRIARFILTSFGGDSRPATLAKQMRSTDPLTRGAAAMGYARSGAEDALARISALLRDPVPAVRRRAISALVLLDTPRAIPKLIPILTETDPALRSSAYGALIRISGEKLKPDRGEWQRWWVTAGREKFGLGEDEPPPDVSPEGIPPAEAAEKLPTPPGVDAPKIPTEPSGGE